MKTEYAGKSIHIYSRIVAVILALVAVAARESIVALVLRAVSIHQLYISCVCVCVCVCVGGWVRVGMCA